MRSVVVENHVDVPVRIDTLVDALKEAQELLVAMARLTLGYNRSLQYVERSKQSSCSVALIVVRLALRQARSQRENGLGAIQRLNLALLVHAQNDRFIRRVDIGPTMPRTFGANCGSLLNLNDSTGRALYAPTRSL